MSKRLTASYVADWVVLAIIAALAGIFSVLEPHAHDFSLLDLNISFPLRSDTVPIWVAGVVAGVVPAIIIVLVSFLLVPGRANVQSRSRSELLRLRLWEWHTGWLGLAMSLALALAITQGLKNFGKPRPNALARCVPDFNNVAKYVVGGYGQDISDRWTIVTKAICTQTDPHILKDAFQSWPSGHSSTAFSGLLYLTLYLCSKFAVGIPYLPQSAAQALYKRTEQRGDPVRLIDEAAAPPLYTLFFILVPLGGAFYIALSRWMDYAHHGFDVISGSLIGIVTAYVSFRWYHLPLSRGAGWSWGPRSANRAFGIGVGTYGYVEERENRTPGTAGTDMEMGLMNPRPSQQQDKYDHQANMI